MSCTQLKFLAQIDFQNLNGIFTYLILRQLTQTKLVIIARQKEAL